MDEIYHEALRLLRRRDYTVGQLRGKLQEKFGDKAEPAIEMLLARRFLDDARYAENHAAKRAGCHPALVREELAEAGVASEVIEHVVAVRDWPSIHKVLKAKMIDWHLDAPLDSKSAARLFRALRRLGFPEDEIREELEQLHEQQ